MVKKIFDKDNIQTAVNALLPVYTVYAPTGKDERLAFTNINADNSSELNLLGSPLIPPKEVLFPRSESLYSMNPETGLVTEPEIAEKTLIFGVRPCDMRSIENLDAVFLEKGYVDSNYAKRRKNTTVVTLVCSAPPNETCFCESMGGDPAKAEGSDIILTETKKGDGFVAESLTEKGDLVLALWNDIAEIKGEAAASEHNSLVISKPDDLAKKLTAAFDETKWAKLSEACLGCGTCSFVCPTCYCFDIDRENNATEITEYRCWDCCMFSDYSRMAGGHNPRPTKKERLRNRYLHKLSYFDERYGKTLCVGCGRCITKCPASLDITEVIEWGGAL